MNHCIKRTITAWMLDTDDISTIGKDDKAFVHIDASKTKKWYIDGGCGRKEFGYVRVRITIETIDKKAKKGATT